MCGIGGYVNVTDPHARRMLTFGLGLGIDARGGDAAGYVSIPDDGGTVRYGRVIGEFAEASPRFWRAASTGAISMLHARFATHQNAKDVRCAHPFALKRGGRTVLYGAHNGVMSSAYESAAEHGRHVTVDSLELFELLADEAHAEINQQNGWGVISWIRADDKRAIRLCVLSDGGSLYVCKTKCGAVVYGSTKSIVDTALDMAEMTAAAHYKHETGAVYAIRVTEKGVAEMCTTDEPRMMFAEEAVFDWAAYCKDKGLDPRDYGTTHDYGSDYKYYEKAGAYAGAVADKEEIQVYGLPEDRDDPTPVDVAWDRAAYVARYGAEPSELEGEWTGNPDQEDRDEWDAAQFNRWCAQDNETHARRKGSGK